MIRPEFYSSITNALESEGHFKAEEFIIKEVADKPGPIIHIEYKFSDSCIFRTNVPTEKKEFKDQYGTRSDYHFNIWMSPGGIASSEREIVIGRSALLGAITTWTKYIHEDLRATPTNRRLDEQQSELENLMKSMVDLPNEFFSREEAKHIKARLEDLENRLRNNFQAQVEDKEKLKTKLDSMTRDFAELKMQLDSLKKPKWGGALMVRILRWTKEPENQNLLKSGVEVVQNLLTDGKPGPE